MACPAPWPRKGSITEDGRPARAPRRDRVPVVQRPLVPELARLEHLPQRRVPSVVPLENFLAVALRDPGLMLVGRVLVVGNHVDELTAADSVVDDRAMRPQPEALVRLQPPGGQVRDRDDAAVADLAGELRRIGSEQARADRRVDAVSTDDDVGLDLAAVGEA